MGSPNGGRGERASGPVSGSIGAIIGQFKSVVTKRINRLRGAPGAPVWQRNYYERIIRNEKALTAIRRYIDNNPMAWAYDRDNPKASRLSPNAERQFLFERYGFGDEEQDLILHYREQYR